MGKPGGRGGGRGGRGGGRSGRGGGRGGGRSGKAPRGGGSGRADGGDVTKPKGGERGWAKGGGMSFLKGPSRGEGVKAATEPKKLSAAQHAKARNDAKSVTKAVVKDAVAHWEKFRTTTAPKAERERHADAALDAMAGDLVALCMGPKTARVAQSALKCASDAKRAAAFAELTPHMAELAKGRHAHFVVKKLLDYFERNDTAALESALKRKTAMLLRQQWSAGVVDHLYHLVSAKRRRFMLLELYGKEFTLFGAEDNVGAAAADADAERAPTLPRLLAKASGADARREILRRTYDAMWPCIEKGLVDSPLVHKWLAEFLPVCLPGQMEELVEALCGPVLLRMMHTKDGAAACAWIVSRATPKQRKALAKACKGHVAKIASNEHGAIVMAAFLSVLDDTALANKALLGELRAGADDVVCSRAAGRMVAAVALAPPSATSVGAEAVAMFEACGVLISATQGENADADADAGELAGDGDDDSDDEGDIAAEIAEAARAKKAAAKAGTSGVSKKAGERRRQELLGGSGQLGATVCAAAARNVGKLMRDSKGAGELLVALVTSTSLAQACPEGLAEVCEAIAEEAAREEAGEAEAGGETERDKSDGDEGEDEDEEEWEPVRTHFSGSRLLRRLLQASPLEGLSPSLAARVWQRAVSGKVSIWGKDHGAKVVAALCASVDADVAKAAAQEVKAAVKAGELAKDAVRVGGKRAAVEVADAPKSATKTSKRLRK